MTMNRRRGERGIALAYVGVMLFTLLVFTGLAVDLGRTFQVKSDLNKAVDAAALAAARQIGSGQNAARNAATKIFNMNFPTGYLGVTSVGPATVDFATVASGPNVGASLITVSAPATLDTTFMRIGGFNNIALASSSQSTRRLVDLAFVIDHSGSLGSDYPTVKTASQQFVQFFDPVNDRIALVMYGAVASIADSINVGGRGFNQASILNHISNSSSTGATATPEALFRGWDQLRAVPNATQSGLRVLVLFTDGAPNTFSGTFQVDTVSGAPFVPRVPPVQGGLSTGDFATGTGSGSSTGLYPTVDLTASYLNSSPPCSPFTVTNGNCWNGGNSSSPYTSPVFANIPLLPFASTHPSPISAGMPTSFNLYDPGLANQRTLAAPTTGTTLAGFPYANHVRNASNAARNLTESIANNIRSDASGANPIHIYTLGLGAALTATQGPLGERGDTILLRVSNDPVSASFNSAQPEGKYYAVATAGQLNAAFQQIRDQIIRISQ